MESKQRLIIVKVERLQELQSDLDRIHQEQAALVNELVQLTSVVPHLPRREIVWVRKLLPSSDTWRRTQHRWLLNRFVHRAQQLQSRTLKKYKWGITYTLRIKFHIWTDPTQLIGPVSSQT